jgi:septin family protein
MSYVNARDSVLSMSCFSKTPDASVGSLSNVEDDVQFPFTAEQTDAGQVHGMEILPAASEETGSSNQASHGIAALDSPSNAPTTGSGSEVAPDRTAAPTDEMLPELVEYCPLVTSVWTNRRYNFMVAGAAGAGKWTCFLGDSFLPSFLDQLILHCFPIVAGKTTFCRTTFRRHFANFTVHSEKDGPTMQICECGWGEKTDEDTKEKIRVTVIDTVGGYSSAEHIQPILDYLEKQHEVYERQELFRRPNERAMEDTRIVCLFYFFGPHRVHEDDVRFLKGLHDKVPIVPIVAKADSLTVIELAKQLRTIRDRLETDKIQYYDFEEEDIDDEWLNEPLHDEVFTKLGSIMAGADREDNLPVSPQRRMVKNVFAVISNQREYIWGTAREDDPTHSDTMRLHRVLFGSLGKLADKMDNIHETWRIRAHQQKRRSTRMKLITMAFVTLMATLFAVVCGLYFRPETAIIFPSFSSSSSCKGPLDSPNTN